jgi:hypothetical protein
MGLRPRYLSPLFLPPLFTQEQLLS